MNADNYGSFSIFTRLMKALARVRHDDVSDKKSRILQAFFEKYSTAPTDLVVLFELLLAQLPGMLPCSGATDATIRLKESAADDMLIAIHDGVTLSDVPFSSCGNLTLSEARRMVELLHRCCSPGGRSVLTAVEQSWLKSSSTSVTREEWEVIRNIAFGQFHRNVGPNTKREELLRCVLGPVAAGFFAGSGGKDVRGAVLVASDGSPKMMREASIGGSGDEWASARVDDVAAGFASEDDSEDAERAPPVKKPRVEVAAVVTPPMDAAAAPHQHPCMYGATCRRKNPEHFKKYSHPPGFVMTAETAEGAAAPGPTHHRRGAGTCTLGDAIAATGAIAVAAVESRHTKRAAEPAVDFVDPKLFAIRGVIPLRGMKEHEFVLVENSGGGYKMKNCGGGTYTCSCPVWRYQNRSTNERSCKHLQAYLGEEFERVRCGADAPGSGGVAVGGAVKAASPPAGTRKVAMPGVLLANKANNKGEYVGWWVSEKLDGVRAYWNGTYLLSRNGNIFTAPEYFTSCLPKDQTLDGELFGGRKKFQTTVGIVKSSASHPGWATLTYELFDTPSLGSSPFEERIKMLNALFPKGGPAKHVHVVEQELCTGAAFIAERLAAVEEVGGEGLMLREPGSKYVGNRSNTLLKVKSTEEVDAIVRAHDPGKGKHAGRCGALLVELSNGKQFCVGSGLSDAQRSSPPPVGTVVAVKYQELTDGGIPRFPVFVGCRYDIDWPPAKP